MLPIDTSVLDELSLLDEDPDSPFLANLVRLFERTTGEALPRLKTAATEGRLLDIARDAHSLKSSAGNLGARIVSGISAEIERAALSQNASALASLLPQLEAALPSAIDGLQAYVANKAA